MLTPKFKLDQNDKQLVVTIYAPFANISEAEIHTDEETFTFYSSPYYLRLTLPGKLVDSEEGKHKGTFNADDGAFVIECIKKEEGEFFSGLDMLTKLLTPKGTEKVDNPLIEVVHAGDDEESSDVEDGSEWFFEQKLPIEIKTSGYMYGFANKQKNVFSTLQSELCGVIDIVDPDNKSHSQRREERIKRELGEFDEDHYLADLFERDSVEQCVTFVPKYYSVTKENVCYTSDEEESLLRLPRKEYLLESDEVSSVCLSLVDLVYSWCFDHRITHGEGCVESTWNICKISPTLSWLESFETPHLVARSCMRRSLIYPLIRSWDLAEKVLQDTSRVFSLGRKFVLKVLLEMQCFLNGYEPRYILNQLYVTDYCCWVQTVKEEKLTALSQVLQNLVITKCDLDLELDELEAAAKMVLEEEVSPSSSVPDLLNGITETVENLAIEDTIIENGFAMSLNDNEPNINRKEVHLSENFLKNGGVDLASSEDSDSNSSEDTSDSDEEDSDDSSSDNDESQSSLDSDDDSDIDELITENLHSNEIE